MVSSERQSEEEYSSLSKSCSHLTHFSSYEQLTELNFSHAQLKQIDTFPFEQFPHLLCLDLSYNQLVSINPQWSKSSKNTLEKLDLSHNQLETLVFLQNLRNLKSLNVTDNPLRTHERYLTLDICPAIEHLIDSDEEQIYHDQLKLNEVLSVITKTIHRLWSFKDQASRSFMEDFRRSLLDVIEKDKLYSQFHLSPLANYILEQKIRQFSSQSKPSFRTHLTDDFNLTVNILDRSRAPFQPIKFLRSHHQSNKDLCTTPVQMCALTSNSLLATCGGRKVCFIDCETCTITHLFEVTHLRSTARKLKDQNGTKSEEYFSCLCWMDITDSNSSLKVLAVGATNGHVYLLSPKWKVMFGHIELPTSSISSLAWHSSDPLTLVIGSYHTVRFISIRSYIDRLQVFLRKQNKPSTPFDYVDSAMFVHKVATIRLYNLYSGNGPLIVVTDLLFYSSTKTNLLLLVGTTAGLFVIKYHEEQSFIQLALPKPIWTVSEHVESLRLINQSLPLIAMNILGLEEIHCFDLERSIQSQRLHIILSFPNPSRQMATKMAVFSTSNDCDHLDQSFECIIGSHHGSSFYHRIHFDKTPNLNFEIPYPQTDPSFSSRILSASLNDKYLCLTTSDNLLCIYKRQ